MEGGVLQDVNALGLRPGPSSLLWSQSTLHPDPTGSTVVHAPHVGDYGFMPAYPQGGFCNFRWPVYFFCPFLKGHDMNWKSYRRENEGKNILFGLKAKQASHLM